MATNGDTRLIWFEVVSVISGKTGNEKDDLVVLRPRDKTDLTNSIIVTQEELERIRDDG